MCHEAQDIVPGHAPRGIVGVGNGNQLSTRVLEPVGAPDDRQGGRGAENGVSCNRKRLFGSPSVFFRSLFVCSAALLLEEKDDGRSANCAGNDDYSLDRFCVRSFFSLTAELKFPGSGLSFGLSLEVEKQPSLNLAVNLVESDLLNKQRQSGREKRMKAGFTA